MMSRLLAVSMSESDTIYKCLLKAFCTVIKYLTSEVQVLKPEKKYLSAATVCYIYYIYILY